MTERAGICNKIGGHALPRAFSCMLLAICLITQMGCRSSEQSQINGDTPPLTFAALDRSVGLDELPVPFPFYRRKGDDIFWYEKEQGVFDPSGVIMRDYGAEGIHYHPVLIASYALRLYDTYRSSGNSDAGERFLRNASWLAENLQAWHGGWAWVYEVPNPAFGANGMWISGMAQGLSIAVLAQAEALTGDKQFLEAARRAMDVFEMQLHEGGVLTVLPEGWWYEEVAGPEIESSLILNGGVYALVGLGYYADLTGDQHARNLYEKGLVGLLELLAHFDGLYSSRYCLAPSHEFRPAGESYNLVHVQQLIELWRRERDPAFAEFALKFLAYQADGALQNEIAAHTATENGLVVIPESDIGDLVSGVKGFWDYSSYDSVIVSIQDNSELPLSGVAVREWQGNGSLSDFDIILNTDEGNQQLLTVLDGVGLVLEGELTREKIRNREAYVWLIGLDDPHVVQSVDLHIDDERIGLRQLILVHSYRFIAAPVETRFVLQPNVSYLFDAQEDTFWTVPDDNIELVLWRESPTAQVELLWSEAVTGIIRSCIFRVEELKERNVINLDASEGKTWSAELELISENLLQFTISNGCDSQIRLHEFVGQERNP